MNNKGKKYYTLAERTDGIWSPQFGDYDKSVVMEECWEYIACGALRANIKMICTDDNQIAIEQRILELNA